jgi:hypothetical protein
MKRFLTILLLICACQCAHTQIAPIQTSEKPYEFIDRLILHWKDKGTYELYIKSSNQFEDKVVRFKLGNSPEQAMESLQNLNALYGQDNMEFELEGRKCGVHGDRIYVYKRGDLQYTAGDYCIYNFSMKYAIQALCEHISKSKFAGAVTNDSISSHP